ncbi:PREDICTED: uncharacterized protein LOC105364303 isoform X2 [Ceratosolen solmsi marchali]|uniref:Uncharacterized protein LOC105364303 isoform X2 n=1 Tax=Ceratosolen solmsi marchali TaxID=326594 RepID=A0AAJ6YM09_9HYME|nr:PREDICTED: uncharacterized protein LOC105364303 isoform X2 [Ceratosolen solmsi marchali]
MGCNTSKESIQQAVEEAKEDVKETAKDIVRDFIGDETKNGDVTKSVSAEIANNSLAKGSETEIIEAEAEGPKKEKEESGTEDSEGENSVDKAATRIQAAFRGHLVRQSMKNTGSSTKQGQNTEPEPTKEQLEQEFREDDKDLCHAATKIQATFRGHMSRKVDQAATAAKGLVESAAEKIEEKIINIRPMSDLFSIYDGKIEKSR